MLRRLIVKSCNKECFVWISSGIGVTLWVIFLKLFSHLSRTLVKLTFADPILLFSLGLACGDGWRVLRVTGLRKLRHELRHPSVGRQLALLDGRLEVERRAGLEELEQVGGEARRVSLPHQLELLHVDALALGAGLHPAAVRVPPHHPAAVVAHGRGAGGGGGGARREREREARGICDSRSVGGSLFLSLHYSSAF